VKIAKKNLTKRFRCGYTYYDVYFIEDLSFMGDVKGFFVAGSFSSVPQTE